MLTRALVFSSLTPGSADLADVTHEVLGGVCVWQRALRALGVQTASTRATVTTEPSAVRRMESAAAALDGQDSTVLSVCVTVTHFFPPSWFGDLH